MLKNPCLLPPSRSLLTVIVLIGGWLFALFVFAAMLLAAWEYVTLWRKGHQTRRCGWSSR